MNLRLNDLRNFLETAGCSTMSEASTKLGITQPALSESIRRLEADLDHTLFYRSRTGIQLTAMGLEIWERSRVAIGALDSIDPTKELGRTNRLRIGCHMVVASYTLPAALKLLSKDFGFQLELTHDLSRNIQRQIQRGALDLGVVINPTAAPDLVIRRLAFDDVCVWGPANGVTPDRIICDIDLFQTQTILRKWKSHPGEMIPTGSLELIPRLVEAGLGYGIVPERAVNLSKCRLKKFGNLPIVRDEICLVYRPEFGRNPFEKAVISSIKGAFEDG